MLFRWRAAEMLCYGCKHAMGRLDSINDEVDMVHGRIVIDTARCKGCELCVTFCPQHVIRLASWFNAKGYRPAELVDPEGACTGCAVCALICPDVAIEVYRDQQPRPANEGLVKQPKYSEMRDERLEI